MIFTCPPPHLGQRCMSMSNTRRYQSGLSSERLDRQVLHLRQCVLQRRPRRQQVAERVLADGRQDEGVAFSGDQRPPPQARPASLAPPTIVTSSLEVPEMPTFRHSYRGRLVLAVAALGTALTAPALAQTCP